MAYSSAKKTILIKVQTTIGTATTPAKDVGLVSDISDSLIRNVIEVSDVQNIEVQKILGGEVSVASNVSVQISNGRFFEFVTGSVSHQTTSADTAHTFTVNDDANFFTMESSERGSADTGRTYEGCFVPTAELAFAVGSNLALSVDIVGRTVLSAASATAKVDSALQVFPPGLVTVTLGSTILTQCQAASIRCLKTITPVYGPTDNLAVSIVGTGMRFEFSFTAGFDARTIQELGIGGTAPPGTALPAVTTFEILADNGISLGSGKRAVQWKLDNIQFDSPYEVVASVGGVIFVTQRGTGLLNTLKTTDNIPSASW